MAIDVQKFRAGDGNDEILVRDANGVIVGHAELSAALRLVEAGAATVRGINGKRKNWTMWLRPGVRNVRSLPPGEHSGLARITEEEFARKVSVSRPLQGGLMNQA